MGAWTREIDRVSHRGLARATRVQNLSLGHVSIVDSWEGWSAMAMMNLVLALGCEACLLVSFLGLDRDLSLINTSLRIPL